VEEKCTLHNSIVFAISVSKIIKISRNWTKLWWKNYDCFYWDTLYSYV